MPLLRSLGFPDAGPRLTQAGSGEDRPWGGDTKRDIEGRCELGLGSCFNGPEWVHL